MVQTSFSRVRLHHKGSPRHNSPSKIYALRGLLYSRIFGPRRDNLFQFTNDEMPGLHEEGFLSFFTPLVCTPMPSERRETNLTVAFSPHRKSSVLEVIGRLATPDWKRDLIVERS